MTCIIYMLDIDIIYLPSVCCCVNYQGIVNRPGHYVANSLDLIRHMCQGGGGGGEGTTNTEQTWLQHFRVLHGLTIYLYTFEVTFL